ncbi:MAG: hypothetical protein M1832_001024 [Thelocarpon impressellum]|nr:MAG: hypothetical protein M1832_001024 [Thelocarpon impressellum]
MSSNSMLSYIGWTFLPGLVTGWIQSVYYGITVRAGDPKPAPGSPRHATHRRRIHIGVILLYLLYSIVEADWQLRRDGDFYRDLGVGVDVDERGIKSRFRRLAALHHPDKVTSHEAREASEALFVRLKTAQDVLLDPTKRFAYDRFGPAMLEWKHCASVRDYLMIGVQTIMPYYVLGAIFMIILGFLGFLEWGRYWRYISLISLLVFEAHTITRPYFPPLTSRLLTPLSFLYSASHRPYLPFQQLLLARKLLVTLYIALSQLGPLLSPPPPSGSTPTPPLKENAQPTPEQLARLTQLCGATDFEAARLLGLDLAPYAGDEASLAELRARLKEWLVQNTIRADPEVRDAVGQAVARRREGAPHGAKGTT